MFCTVIVEFLIVTAEPLQISTKRWLLAIENQQNLYWSVQSNACIDIRMYCCSGVVN